MLKTVFSHLGEYKRAAVITPILIVMEVVMEVLIPIVISYIIDRGVQAGDMRQIVFYGMIMLGMAFLSLFFGVMGARMSSKASTGLAANLRQAVYEKVQTFSFANIDRFSTAGLVTRMTTDVTNVQNAFQMLLRVAVRAPLMMIGSLIMCFSLSRRLSVIFLIALVFLAVVLILIMVRTLPLFNVMFNKYDDLNASIQENVTAIRVVKAFVREEYENEKFEKAAAYIKNISVKAERLLILNMPVMMTSVYFCMIGLSWFGAHLIVLDQFTTGQLTSMFSYVMAILMSLMMLSMIFVMLSMSLVSAKRIAQVLEEEPAITDPAEPLTEVPDGSIVFDHVDFAYTSGDGAEGESGEYVLQDIDLHIESGETIGIVGGMGPYAGMDLERKIFDCIDAKSDQDYPDVIMISASRLIPDRSYYIMHPDTENPCIGISYVVQKLAAMGATHVAIPCNTAHFYYDQMQERVPVPIIHMIRETAGHCRKEGFEKVGILATDGTVGTDLYRKELQKVGIEAVYPSEGQQKRVMSAIYDYVKAGRKIEEDYLSGCIAELEGEGCQAFILGCTELPIIFKARRGDPRYVNTLQVLARAVIERSGYVCRRTGG